MIKSLIIHDAITILIFIIIIVIVLKKTKPSFQSIIIALFISIIFFPFLQQNLNIIRYRPIQENRTKLKPPEGKFLVRLFNEGAKFSQEYEKYYNDNYGFRDNFIRLKNQIDYSVFGISDEVIIGKDNWLFYKSVVERENIYIEQMSDSQFQKIQDKFLSLNSELKSKGILLVVVPVPMKSSIYPEFYINPTAVRPETTRFDKLITFLKSHPEIKFINASEILTQNKANYQVFYKTDFHWNDYGAFFVSRQIVDSISLWTKNNIQWSYPLKTENYPGFFGGQNDSLAVFLPPKESAIRIFNNLKSQTPDPNAPQPFLSHFKSLDSSKKLLPKTVVIGNSYMLNFYNNGLFDHFSEVLVAHSNDMAKTLTSLPKDTKIVIFQLIEIDLLKNFLFE